MATFSGLPRDAMQFWHELQAEMSREWFAANKERYQRTWVEPLTALLDTAAARLRPSYRGLELGPPRVLRIQRDLRFSKDKSPYKTWIGAGIPVGAARPQDGATALYVHFGAQEEFVGAGRYVFMDATLAKWRKLVAGKPGAEIAAIVTDLRRRKFQTGAYETMARVPRGFDPEHPRAELLRMKGLVVSLPPIPRGLIHQPAFLDWCVEHARTAAPLVRWLARHLA
jgi:uncharacterized protein (TIGR02453 family)